MPPDEKTSVAREAPSVRRPRGRVALALVFALLALNALAQVVAVPLGVVGDPPALTALQALVAATGGAAAWGSWAGARWGARAALLHGLALALLFVLLDPLLSLGREARAGLWGAAATALVFGAWAAWYLRRAADRAAARGAPPR